LKSRRSFCDTSRLLLDGAVRAISPFLVDAELVPAFIASGSKTFVAAESVDAAACQERVIRLWMVALKRSPVAEQFTHWKVNAARVRPFYSGSYPQDLK
jgi:hypothetical protein